MVEAPALLLSGAGVGAPGAVDGALLGLLGVESVAELDAFVSVMVEPGVRPDRSVADPL
jgi:hypothetical protein